MKLGQRYRCSVCGAETLVIRAGKGEVRTVCCNQPMRPMKNLTEILRCPVCGSEVAVLKSKSETMRVVCCNVPMATLVPRAA